MHNHVKVTATIQESKLLIQFKFGPLIKETRIKIPQQISKHELIYNRSVYANPIYACHPDLPTTINGLDYSLPTSTVGSIIYVNKDLVTSPTVLQRACNSSNSGDVANLDTWDYCRASDIMRIALNDALLRTAQSVQELKSISYYPIKKALTISMLTMRYVGHVKNYSQWKAKEMSSRVLFPPIIQLAEKIRLQSSLLDMSDVPASAVFNQFHLKKGVDLI
jgi:hypothetical protein